MRVVNFTPKPSETKKSVFVDHRAAIQLLGTERIAERLRTEYTNAYKDKSHTMAEGIQAIVSHFHRPNINVFDMVQDAGDVIYRQLNMATVGIGLMDPDGFFRYKILIGFKSDAEGARRKIAYRREEFFGSGDYKGYPMSRYTWLYLAEDKPWSKEDEKGYNRPTLLGMKRMSLTDSVEGDYIDTHIYGVGDDLLGWIEVEGTKTGTIPNAFALRQIELIGMIIGGAIVCQSARDSAKPPPKLPAPSS
jgi:hypothetical protein